MWEEGTIYYYGVTKITNRELVLTVDKKGRISVNYLDDEDSSHLHIGNLPM